MTNKRNGGRSVHLQYSGWERVTMKEGINEYLFLGFGLHAEEEDFSRVSDDGPFHLEPGGGEVPPHPHRIRTWKALYLRLQPKT